MALSWGRLSENSSLTRDDGKIREGEASAVFPGKVPGGAGCDAGASQICQIDTFYSGNAKADSYVGSESGN